MSKSDPRKAFATTFEQLGAENGRVLSVSCDSASGSGMTPFNNKFPDRYIEVGISEQTGIDVAVGLAVNGFVPVISAIAPFISMRAYEQVRNDVGYSQTNVKVVGSSSGLSHSPAGSSHQANEDIALMRTVPNMVILNPGDSYEVEMSLRKAVEHVGPVYIRMPRHAVEDVLPREKRSFEIGKGEEIYSGKNLVVASGTTAGEAKRAVETLRNEGFDIALLNLPTVFPLDEKKLLEMAKNARHVFTVEEHSTVGGLGDAVASCLVENMDAAPRLSKLGIPPGAINTGPYRELLEFYGISDNRIAETVRRILGK